MITSDKQYDSAKEKLSMLTESLSAPAKKGVPKEIEKANKVQVQELIDEIQMEIEEYAGLKNGDPSDIKIQSIDDLMITPIRYRIAAHMSVDAFGRKVGVSARQIARYEQAQYQNTTASTLRKILEQLDIQIDGKVA